MGRYTEIAISVARTEFGNLCNKFGLNITT